MNMIPILIEALGLALAHFVKNPSAEDVWGKVQAFVRIVEDPDIKGTVKRDMVVDRLQELGVEASLFALHFLITLAVAKVKDKFNDSSNA